MLRGFPLLFFSMEVICFENNAGSGSDRALREKAKPFEAGGEDIKKTVGEMLEVLHSQKGVGLAGPQIGLERRIFVTHAEGDIARVFVNPAIIWTSQELAKCEEGCLSLPGVWADVIRPASVKVQAWNENGRAFTLEAEGILARVIQHEYDHLEGILFIDRLAEVKRKKLLVKLALEQAKSRKKTKK